MKKTEQEMYAINFKISADMDVEKEAHQMVKYSLTPDRIKFEQLHYFVQNNGYVLMFLAVSLNLPKLMGMEWVEQVRVFIATMLMLLVFVNFGCLFRISYSSKVMKLQRKYLSAELEVLKAKLDQNSDAEEIGKQNISRLDKNVNKLSKKNKEKFDFDRKFTDLPHDEKTRMVLDYLRMEVMKIEKKQVGKILSESRTLPNNKTKIKTL